MSQSILDRFEEVWLADFEYTQAPGFNPAPICLVAWELKSGRKIRVWEEELLRMKAPPYSCGPTSLFVAYFASAEMNCHLALGWELPQNVLDLFVEFRCLTNGTKLPLGNGLFGAASAFGIDEVDVLEKETMRELAMRGGPWKSEEQVALLDYCEGDVAVLAKLLPKIGPVLRIDQALLRGRYMKSVAHMEHNGIPLDHRLLGELTDHWDEIRDRLIEDIDLDYGVFKNGRFNEERFVEFLERSGISWPRYESTGRLILDDDTFKDMARIHPTLTPLRELRATLAKMRKFELALGPDGRNRCMISPFAAITGRNQPRNSQFIFGPAKWFRHFISPSPGAGLAYLDWSQQEFGIAAALSGCTNMKNAYMSGDSYLGFAEQAGALMLASSPAAKKIIRNQYKHTALAVQYGGSVGLIAMNTGQSFAKAKELLDTHKRVYADFWKWSEAISDFCFSHNYIETVFGWRLRVDGNGDVNPRSILNFPMQANGAEILRLVCLALTEAGIKVCAPVHDAILIEAPLEELDDQVKAAERVMSDASASVLNGFRLRTDAQIIRHPGRFQSEDGSKMWDLIQSLLSQARGTCSSEDT